MPGTLVAGNKLQQAAVAPDKEVRRHGKLVDFAEVGMVVRVQAVLEQGLNIITAELLRRQADVMDHQQGNVIGVGTEVEIG